MINFGPLDRRIRIESPPTAQDANYGTPSGDWTTVHASLCASVQEVLPSKGEGAADGIRLAERPARIRMRYVTGITSAMRVVYLDRGNRAMKILTPPVELGRKDGLEFMVADFSTSGNAA
jgi:head-tail adaptor